MKYERDFMQLFKEASGSPATKKHFGAAIKNNITRIERNSKSKERKEKKNKEKANKKDNRESFVSSSDSEI
jgi:hypothetical protein